MSQFFSQRFQVFVRNLSTYSTASIIGAMGAEIMENALRKGFGNNNRWSYVGVSSSSSGDQDCECDSRLGKLKCQFSDT